MRTDASKLGSPMCGRRTIGRMSRALWLLAALPLLALPPTAAAAAAPPTLTSAFTPVAIGDGGTSALAFTMTNPNTSTLTGIGFTDSLPPGLTVDNPNGLTGTCGAASTLTAPAGGTSVTLTGGTLGANATCTVQISVTSTTPGTYTNSTGNVTSTEGGSGPGDAHTLTVFGLPTASVTSPAENAAYPFGANVVAQYTCQDAPGAPGIAACSGDVDSGMPIDTATPGPGTFSVSAISADGAITTQTIAYVVLPDNRITVTTLAARTGGTVTFKVKVPGAGRLSATLTHDGKPFGQLATRFRSDGTRTLTVKPNADARKLLRAEKKRKHPVPISLKLTVTFVPVGGKAGTPVTRTLSVMP